MYFKCEEEKKETKQNEVEVGYEKEVCCMKESYLWKEVFEVIKFQTNYLWDQPLPKIDIVLEREFGSLRKKHIEEEEFNT